MMLIEMNIQSNQLKPKSLTTFEQMLIKIGRLDTTFQQSNQRSITKGKYHQHPQTAKNFLNEFARFYNVGIVYSDGDFNNQQENLSKYHLKIGKNDSIPDSETIKKSKIQRIKRTGMLYFDLDLTEIYRKLFLFLVRNFSNSQYTTTS